MAKRNRSHVLGDQAVQVVKNALPVEWTSEEVVRDYGRDLMIEVFVNEQSTGLVIGSQSKGQERAKIVHGGTHVRQRITVGRLRYLVELKVPSALFVVDVTKKIVWWMAPQTDADALGKLKAASSNEDEVSLHIPIANVFDATDLRRFMGAMDAASQRVAVSALQTGAFGGFVEALEAEPDLEATLQVFQRNADATRIHHAYRLIQQGDMKSGAKELRSVLGNPTSDAAMKVAAFMYEEGIALREAMQADTLDLDLREIAIARALELEHVLKGAATPYRLFARANRRIAELHLFAARQFQLTFQQMAPGGGLMIAELAEVRNVLADEINRSLSRIIKMIELAIRRARPFIPPLVNKALFALSPLWMSMQLEHNVSAQQKILERVDGLASMGAEIASWLKDWHEVEAVAFAAAQFPTSSKDTWENMLKRATGLLEYVDDLEFRAAAEKRIRQHFMGMKQDWESSDEYDHESHMQFVRNLATTDGIDVDRGTDEYARAIRDGIKDASPERVIKNCEHLFVAMRDFGLLGARFSLPSIGMKEMWCVRHEYCSGGWDLDQVYDQFRQDYCNDCTDCKPRTPQFRWTPSWQESELKRLIDAGKVTKKSVLQEISEQQTQDLANRHQSSDEVVDKD